MSMKTMACVSLFWVAALAQQTAPTFRSSAAVIEVDVIVRDRDGKFMSGLTADDFESFEDGKPQPVQQFYVVSGAPGADAGSTRRHDRMFVFVFDQDHLGAESVVRLKRAVEARPRKGSRVCSWRSGRRSRRAR